MGLNGKRAGRKMALAHEDLSAGPRTSHPAAGYIDFGTPTIGLEAEPLKLAAQSIGSAGLGREYLPLPERHRNIPGELTINYGGGLIDPGVPMGYVDRAKTVEGLHYIWTDEINQMPVSALPFEVTGTPRKSLYGPFLHFKKREAMNGGWWMVVKGLSRNTGFVAQTRPNPLDGTQPNRGPGQLHGGRPHQVVWGLPNYTLEVPRPSTRPRTVPAVSSMVP